MEGIYEKALHEVGIKGRFQNKYFYVYDFLFVLFTSMAYMNLILVIAIPKHHCRLPQIPELILNTNGNRRICLTCTDGYEYDQTWYKSTAVTEFDWVCEKEIYAANVLAYSKISEVIGSFVMGWFGDTYGRKLCFLCAIFLMVSGRFIAIVSSNSFVVFMIGCVIAAFPSVSAASSLAILSSEVSRPGDKKKFMLLQSVGWIIGASAIGFVYWWIRDWWWFFIVTNIPLSLGFIYAWSMIESPKWLLGRGDNRKCIRELQRIAKSNNRNLREATKLELLSQKPPNKKNNVGALALFSSRNLALNTGLLLTCSVANSLILTTINLSSTEETEGSNPLFQYIWQITMEFPGYVLAALIVDRIGRRWTAMSGFALSGLLGVSSALRFYVKSAWAHHWLVNALILGLSKTFITLVNYTICIVSMELNPVCLRQTGMAIGGVLANAAGTLPAYIIYLGRNYSAKLPGLIMGLTAGIGLASMFFLPETMNVKLPDTLEEARVFGKGKRYYLAIPVKLTTPTKTKSQNLATNKAQEIIK